MENYKESNINKNINKKIVLKQTNNRKFKSMFDLAVQSNYRDKAGKFPTMFIPYKSFSKIAKYIDQYMEKRQLIEVIGHV